MDAWNEDYKYEARYIAAKIVAGDGYHWLAGQIRQGTHPRRREVRIAMAALMLARGELEPNLR